ncbi:hypothetical protein DAC20_114 [Bacteroides phage DAC20]|nr:hypothetical protein DAC16_107 [Bacteroides phage DAC16]QIG63606.1 hypothetical protein DAC19_115 [Bacteroides phage DAC19]QIG63867.1 hypothetical protein DAC20_114 [Bacteroides phage DAC20]
MNQYLCYYTVGQTPNLIIGHKYIKAYSEGEAKIKVKDKIRKNAIIYCVKKVDKNLFRK